MIPCHFYSYKTCAKTRWFEKIKATSDLISFKSSFEIIIKTFIQNLEKNHVFKDQFLRRFGYEPIIQSSEKLGEVGSLLEITSTNPNSPNFSEL